MIRNKFSLTYKAMLALLSLFLVLGSIPATAFVYADEELAAPEEAPVMTDEGVAAPEEAPVTTDEELSAPEEAPEEAPVEAPEEAPVSTDEELAAPEEAPAEAPEVPEPVVEEVISEAEVISREALNEAAPAEAPATEEAPAEAPAEETLTDSVYLDPVNGDDSNIGSESKPVKSFERAKEILSGNESVSTVLVMNTIPGDGEMSLPGGVLKRGPGFSGAMIQVAGGKSLNLKDIVIDGDSSQLAEEPAVKVYGTLDINADTVIRNNKRQNKSSQSSPYKTRGGAIRAHRGGIVNMHDGLIEGNYADLGGGVYADGTFNMFGGEIVSNEAFNGGGAHAGSGGTINFHDGFIKNNRANMEGGGISIGGIDDWGMPCELHMFGGTIDGNKSEKAGGGIFIQSNCYAYVGGGNIVNNVGASSRVSYPDNFIGGGIYVNGGYKGIKDGVLELSKVYISGNRARNGGGGIANCPSSTLSAYISNGVAIGGNHETGFMGMSRIPNDFLITSKTVGQHRGNPIMYLASIMLGGGKNNWVHQSSNAAFEPLDEEHQLPNSTTYTLINEISEEDLERGKEKASVIITNNRAATGKGGGIGSNGIVRIGVEYPEYGELTVTKTVDGDESFKSREFNFTVTLDYKFTGTYGDMEFVDGVSTFTLKDGESKTAKDLIPEVEYTVEETDADGFVVSYINGKTGEVSEEAGRGEIVAGETASVEAVNKQVTRVEGSKTWKDDTEEDRPESITVRLYADGEEIDSKEVTAEDEWKYAFEKLPYLADGKVIEYTVTEDEVEGYTTEVSGFEITNTKTPEPPTPDEPEPPTPDEPEPPTPDEPEPPTPDEPEPPSPPTPSTDEPEPPVPDEPDNPPTVDEPEPPTPEEPENPPTVDEPEPPAPPTPSTDTPDTPAKTPDQPKTETTPKTPSTGDTEEPLTWGGVMVLAGGTIAVILSRRRRKEVNRKNNI